ncbi:CDT1 Geminin-binding domain-like-containing protein [Strongyloides ratti]|uniref:CDT1 Geminin-binding domain-like-containing protein n=1 Tax=Strongyloides ratti TaxID=34506 RepID=A0A090LQF1_STRRB|nr:CDT1 Geminin-binding domain-like-containing protein [Strongyloides ratti]CEF69786.1 CDT1 Geminin-binding domain-like-containing protein [Strongyloides ratti]
MPVTTRASSATPSSKEQLGTQSKISGFFYAQKKTRGNQKKIHDASQSPMNSGISDLKRSSTPEPSYSPVKKPTPEKVEKVISINDKPKSIRRRINFDFYSSDKIDLPKISEEKFELIVEEKKLSELIETGEKKIISDEEHVKSPSSKKQVHGEKILLKGVSSTEKIKEITQLMKTNSTVKTKLKKNVKNLQEYHELLAKKGSIKKLVEQGNAIKAATVIEKKTLILSPKKCAVVKKTIPSLASSSTTFVDRLNNLKPKSDNSLDYQVADRPLNSLSYGKTAGLNQEIKDVSEKELPGQLGKLLEIFESTDRIFALQSSHNKRSALDDIIDAVKKKLNKTVLIKHYAQILYLYKQSYKITLEKPHNPLGMFKHKSSKEEYVIEPNLEDDLTGYWTPSTPPCIKSTKIDYTPTKLISPVKGTSRRSPSKKLLSTPVKNQIEAITQPRLEPWRLICRRKILKYLLYKFLMNKHDEFLKTKGIVLTSEHKNRLKKFHPDFVVEAADDVPEFELPKPAVINDDVTKKTVKDYFDSIETSPIKLPDSVLKTVEILKSPEKKALLMNKKGSVPLTPTKFKEQKQEIKSGNKLSLLERIKLKEEHKKRLAMLRDPENEARQEKLEKLEKSFLKHVSAYYGIKRCTSVSIDELTDKLIYSMKSINRDQCMDLITFVCEIAPDYFTINVVRGKKYLKMASTSLNQLMDIVKKEMDICRSKSKIIYHNNKFRFYFFLVLW